MRAPSITLVAATASVACGRLGFEHGAPAPDAAPDQLADAAAVAVTYVDEVLADGPVVYYRLDDDDLAAGAHDSSGNGFHTVYERNAGGTLEFGLPGALPGDPDRSVAMFGEGNAGDGGRANVLLPLEAYVFDGDFTIEFWFRARAVAPGGWRNSLFIWEDYQNSGFRTGWNQDDQLEFWTDEAGVPTGPNSVHVADSATISSGWNHVAFVRAGASVRIYLSGELLLDEPLAYLPPPPDNERGFGAYHGMPSAVQFDEVAVYGRALPAARIAAHVAAATP